MPDILGPPLVCSADAESDGGGGTLMADLLVIPSDATEDSTFRCTKFACTLAFRHCLRRQAERRKRSPVAKDQTPLPVHEYCATACPDGRVVAARFGAVEAPLTVVNGVGATVVYAPKPPAPMPVEPPAPPAQETTMPRGKHPPCPGCGSTGRHKNVCPVKNGKPVPPAARSTPPSARPARIAIAVDLEALVVDDLLARRATLREDLRAVDAALRARAEKLEAQRKAVLEAVADAA